MFSFPTLCDTKVAYMHIIRGVQSERSDKKLGYVAEEWDMADGSVAFAADGNSIMFFFAVPAAID